MACYAALTSLSNLLEDVLHCNQYPHVLLGRHQIIESLHKKFSRLLYLLQYYSSKGDGAAGAIKSRIRDAAYQAQDIIESEILKQGNSEFGNHVFKESFQNLLCPETEDDLQKVGREVDFIVEEMKAIKESQAREDLKAAPLNLFSASKFKDLKILRDKPDTADTSIYAQDLKILRFDPDTADTASSDQPPVGTNTMVGLEEYLERIKGQLFEQSSQLQAIQIVWMEGKGKKNTLTKNALNDDGMVKHFGIRARVNISKDYNVIGVLQDIRKSLPIPFTNDLHERGALLRHISTYLKDQRYLIIVDNSFCTNAWDDLKYIFPDDSNGSRVLIITMLRTEELQKIEDWLFGGSPTLQAISIVGMGGSGKTTFVRNIFDEALTVKHFDFRVWVTISQDYDVIKVLQNILKYFGVDAMDDVYGWQKEALEKHEGEKEEEALDEHEALLRKREGKRTELEKRREEKKDTLKMMIYKYLWGRRYLIVIDDVWSRQIWEELGIVFPNNTNGSRILITTRLTDVAKYASTTYLHEMQFLNDNESWNLLREKAFALEHCPHKLEDIGKFIARKCRGLPLAIVVIAGVLSEVRTVESWRMISRNMDSTLSRDIENLSNILSLSYNHLPHHLKSCFLHMGSFPEDYEISISRLIKLWVAEGFLKSAASKSKSLEKVGEEYLEDLVKRSLVIITKKRVDGQFKSCIIHDLLRDFCRRRSIHEGFFHEMGPARHFDPRFFHEKGGARHLDRSGAEKVRRFILDAAAPSMPWAYEDGKYVRSICWFSKMTSVNIHSLEWGSVKQLRIMDAADIETSVAPFAVSQMFHLKYLALRLGGQKKKHLPRSISKLRNLQTLIIYAPRCGPISLPPEIWKIPQLRHLIIDRMILPPIPLVGDSPFHKLEFLQTLETLEDFTFTNEATRMIPNIKKLKLSCRGEEASGIWKAYCLDNLVNLDQLEKLNISFHASRSSYVYYRFTVPWSLKKLSLEGCRLPWKKLTEVGSLPLLQVLRLRKNSLVGTVWEPTEKEFQSLRFLLMESLDLKYWIADSENFPVLEHLKIIRCRELEEIPLAIGDIPTLISITVHESERAGASAMKIREEQENMGNESLQVHVLSSSK